MKALLLLLVLTVHSVPGAPPQQFQHVRRDGGRYSIACQSVSLEALLREIASITPVELWLDDGLADKRVSLDVESVTLKEALEKVFKGVKVNYVLYSDPSNPERVTKVYAGIGGTGRLGRVPTVVADEPEPVASGTVKEFDAPSAELAPELDPETLLENPDAQDALESLRELFERGGESEATSKEGAGDDPGDENDSSIPAALQELFQQLPPLPESGTEPADETPGEKSPTAPEDSKRKKKDPRQL